MAGVVYGSVLVSAQPGDALLLLTDGIAEATTGSGEQFGYENLLHVLKDTGARQTNALDAAFEIVARLSPDKLEDDCTGLLLTCVPGKPAEA
jgi:serine phosphatase RsbU (regulator of sigma subunit)